MNNIDAFLTQGQIVSALLIIAVALVYLALGEISKSQKNLQGINFYFTAITSISTQ